MAGNPILRTLTVAASATLLVVLAAAPAVAEAPPSPATVGFAEISDLQINGVTTTAAAVKPGAAVSIKATTADTRDASGPCPNCIVHVPAGLAGAAQPAGCLFDSGFYGQTQTRSIGLTAPSEFGVHDVVAAYKWTYFCSQHWDGTGTTIAQLVVALPPESKDDCKKGGWRDLSDLNGDPFKNQGRCVSYFNTVIRKA
jgi:hypothetical protein